MYSGFVLLQKQNPLMGSILRKLKSLAHLYAWLISDQFYTLQLSSLYEQQFRLCLVYTSVSLDIDSYYLYDLKHHNLETNQIFKIVNKTNNTTFIRSDLFCRFDCFIVEWSAEPVNFTMSGKIESVVRMRENKFEFPTIKKVK